MELTHRYPDLTVHLTVLRCMLGSETPRRLEHRDMRWVTPEEAAELPLCPADTAILLRLRQEPFARWIKTVAHGLPLRFDPTVEDSRFLADGHQLILSSFPSDVPVFPVNYDNCHLMNARNEALCRRATGEKEEKEGLG